MLRALAALAVVVGHSVQQGFGEAIAPSLFGRLAWWLGQWGVTLFFVLSGFCIHLPHARRLVADAEAGVDWRRFLRRRAFRLLPPHYVSMAVAAVAGCFIQTNLIGAPTLRNVAAHVFMLHTFFGPAMYYSINGVFWSIAIEVHFYMAYPLYLGMRQLVGTFVVPAVLLAVGLLIYGVSRFAFEGDARFVVQHLFLVTWWQWGLGVLLADLHARGSSWLSPAFRFPGALGLYSVISLVLAWTDVTVLRLHVNAWVLPLVCFFLLGASISRERIRIRFLEHLGTASYSLYLIHPVALASLVVLRGRLSDAGMAILCIVASVIFALAFFQFVERHFIPRRTNSAAPQRATGPVS
ncbi:MAG: acyltransferase [Planctomycetota bacterium]